VLRGHDVYHVHIGQRKRTNGVKERNETMGQNY